MRWRTRIDLFLYSNEHLVASVIALLGLAALWLGLVQQGWIVPWLYGCSWLATYVLRPSQPELTSLAEHSELLPAFEALLHRCSGRLPAEALQQLQRMHHLLEELLPRLPVLGAVGQQREQQLRRILLEYLPQTLDKYLRLPLAYSHWHTGSGNDKTPKQLLLEQLQLLEQECQRQLDSVLTQDLDALAAHSAFLRGKFGSLEFLP